MPNTRIWFECVNGRAEYITFGEDPADPLSPAIGELTELLGFEAEEAYFESLPAEIGNLTKLTFLGLEHNLLTTLPPELGNLTQLRTLRLDENRLTELPPEIGNLTELTKLNLYRNALSELPPEIGNFSKLTELELGKNNLTRLPSEIGNLSSLVELDLEKNQLTEIPTGFGRLSNLTSLWLNHNRLTEISPELTTLPKLRELLLSDNSIRSVSPDIKSLTSLAFLKLKGNDLQTLPAEIGDLRNLQRFDVENNQITELPSEIGNLTKLEDLDLRGNSLEVLPPEIGRLTALQTFRIDRNRLTALPPEIENLDALEYLSLSDNKLGSLPSEIGDVAELGALFLDNNELRSLPSELEGLPHLTTLYVRNNNLRSLPPEIVWNVFEEIALTGNPLESLPVQIGAGRDALISDIGVALAESGFPVPYVAIGECASGTPSLIAIATDDTSTITVDGRTYDLSTHRSQISTLSLDDAGTGPTFSVAFAGKTSTVTCQGEVVDPPDVLKPGEPDVSNEVSIARSCLAGNGRVDFTIVNSTSDARYRIEFQGLNARERTIGATEAWRMPFTGRPDGDYEVKISKTLLADDSVSTSVHNFAIDCDDAAPQELSGEVQVIPYCSAGKGFVRYQFVNPTEERRSYIIGFEGLSNNRSTSARPYGAAIAGVSGRPDGTYTTTVEYGDSRGTPMHTETVTIACADN